MRRILSIIAIALWGVLVACYWRACVPLKPLVSIPFVNNVEPVGWTADGDVVVVPTLNWPNLVANDPYFGPVQVWRFPEGRLIRELFTADHQVHIDGFLDTGEVTGIRAGEWSLCNASTGETVGRIPVAGSVNSFRKIPDRNLIIYSEGNFVRCYDTVHNAVLWSTEGFRGVRSLGPDFVVVGKAVVEPHGWASGNPLPLSLKDGQLLSRFDHLGRASWISPSPDGRLAAVYLTGQKKFAVCDALTGEVRWTGTVSFPVTSFGFDEASHTFRCGGRQSNGDSVFHRWSAEDGTRLEPEVTHRAGQPWRSGKAEQRFVIESKDQNVGFEATVRRLLRKTPLARLIPPNSAPTWLVDGTTFSNLGLISTGRKITLRMLTDEGVIVFAGTHIDYFQFPPTRNWRWLLLWSSLPPLGLWAVVTGARRVCRRDQRIA